MKKLFISFLFLAIALSGYAQDGLKGSWIQKFSMMGMSGNETMTFSDNNSGKLTNKMVMTINMNMFGIKITGEANGSVEGSFKYEGDKIVINWDADSFKFNTTKPIDVILKDEQKDNLSKADLEKLEKSKKEMRAQFDELIEEAREDMRKTSSKGEVYSSVKVNAKKLTYKSVDSDGKTQSEKYTRVQ